MPCILPVSDLRNYNEVLQNVSEESPVFLTKNGRGCYVVIDIKEYERMVAALKLQKALADKGITATELSRLSGVGKSDISNYINGAYVAKQDKCFMLARALDVDPGWLMTGDEPPVNRFPGVWELPQVNPGADHDLLELIVSYNKAEEWQRQAVRKILNMKGKE